MKFKLNRYTPLLEDSNGGQKTFKLFLAELKEADSDEKSIMSNKNEDCRK